MGKSQTSTDLKNVFGSCARVWRHACLKQDRPRRKRDAVVKREKITSEYALWIDYEQIPIETDSTRIYMALARNQSISPRTLLALLRRHAAFGHSHIGSSGSELASSRRLHEESIE